MPQEQDIVRIEWNGKTGVVPRDRLQRYLDDGAMLLQDKTVEEPKKGKPSLWEAANKPIGKDINETYQGLNRKMDDWIAKHAPSGTPDAVLHAVIQGANLPGDLIGAVTEAGRESLSPLGIATLGLASKLQALRQAPNTSKLLKGAIGAAETGTGVGFGAAGAQEAFTARPGEDKLSEFRRRLSGLGQSLMGASALGHVAGPPIKEKASKIAGNTLMISPEDIAKEVSERRESFEKAQKEYESGASQKLGLARSEHEKEVAAREADIAQKEAKHEADLAEQKAKHEAQTDASERALAGRVTRQAHAQLKNERLKGAEQKLNTAREDVAKKVAENIDQSEAAEAKHFDDRYEQFRKQVLGVSDQAPNGTLQSKLSPIGEAVLYAKKNLLKGSKTNITIFNDIMGRLKDLVEGPEGELKPLEGQMIPTDQLRGYSKELGDAIYNKEHPYDVKDALKYVRDKANGEVGDTIRDTHGQGVLDAYKRLNEEYSNYKRLWYDTSSVNPLPKILDTLRDPTVVKEGIPVHDRISKIVKGEKGSSIVKLLASKMKFGANPKLAAQLMALDQKLARVGKLYENIPIAKYPRFPGQFEPPERPKMPELITEAKLNLPTPPEKPDLNETKILNERLGEVVKKFRKFGYDDKSAIVAGLAEMALHQSIPYAWAYPIIKRLVGAGLSTATGREFVTGGRL